MGFFSNKGKGDGPQDPRDPVGKNPTGRARKSSAGSRRKAEKKLDKDLEGTQWQDPKKKK